MGLFGFGKSYSKDDLQREITKLEGYYRQAMAGGSKRELAQQLSKVLEIYNKGGFSGMETV